MLILILTYLIGAVIAKVLADKNSPAKTWILWPWTLLNLIVKSIILAMCLLGYLAFLPLYIIYQALFDER